MEIDKHLRKSGLKSFDFTLLIAPLITVIMLLIVFYIKGIYPFGEGTTVDFDCTYKIVPEYFYLHDAWHGGSLFYDFMTAGGFARDMTLSLLRIGNVFMLLFPRNQIVNAMNYLLIFRMAIVAFTASYSLKNLFPNLPKYWVCIVALMYTFCGYNLEYFTYIEWLEAVALFPLVVLFTIEMFRGKSRLPFFFTLLYFILIDTYFSYFTIVGLIVFGGLYIFIVEDKDKRKRDIFNLGVGTLGAILAGGYQIYYFLINNFTSARFEMNPIQFSSAAAQTTADNSASAFSNISAVVENTSEASGALSGILTILKSGFHVFNIAFFMLIGAELAIASLIMMWFRFKKHKEIRRHTVFFTVSFSLLILQLFLRSSDLLWHGGSYACFPVRNGFILGFCSCCTVAYYFSKLDTLDGIRIKNDAVRFLVPVFCAFSAVFVIPQLLVFKSQIGNDLNIFDNSIVTSYSFLRPFLMLFFSFSAIFVLFKVIKKECVRSLFTVSLLLLYLTVNTYAFIGDAALSEKAIRNSNFYGDSFDVRKNANNIDSLSRINNPDLSLFINYPYVAGTFSISNWTATLSQNQLDAFNNLGFSTYYTDTMDCGGTLFSKSLMRVKKTVSKAKLDNRLYSKEQESEKGLLYYNCLYSLPLGITFNKDLLTVSYDDFENTFEYQNAIFNSLGHKGELFKKITPYWYNFSSFKNDVLLNDSVVGDYDVNTTQLKATVSDKQVLYLNSKKDSNVCIVSLYCNNCLLSVPSGQEVLTKFSGYPQSSNNNVFEFGVFENEDVELRFDFKEGSLDDINLYALDLNKLQELCDSYEENSYEVGSDWVNFCTYSENEGDIIFLPIAYDNEWKCSINGKEVEPICVLEDFIGLPAQQGINEVKMYYSHRQGYIHVAASIILLFAAFITMKLIDKKEDYVPRFIYIFTKAVFTILFSVVLTVLYVIPLVSALISI